MGGPPGQIISFPSSTAMIFALPLAALVASAAAETANQWATYPSVPKTATINGFADPVFDSLPECAQPCVKESTSSTPCPYWDTGCLCVMTTWSSKVTECYAEKCTGSDAQKAYDASVNICKNAGVWEPYWIVNDAAKDAVSSAAAKEPATSEAAESTPATSSSAPEQTTEETTTQGEATSATSQQAQETGETETTEAAETTAQESAAESAQETEAAESTEGAASSAAPSAAVSSYEGAAQGVFPAAAVGVAAGVAMLL